MRTWLKLWIVALGLMAAWALAAPAAFGQIADTDHDFTPDAPDPCVTCHVPHNPGSGLGLLWNHTLSSVTLTFGSGQTTVAGTDLPTDIGAWTGTTKYCLSCHDGSVAVGDVISGTDWGTSMITGSAVIAPSGDLLGNHPVAIPYPGSAGTYNGITTGIPTPGADWVDKTAVTGVRLYADGAGTGIECGSCHDPHNDSNEPFLRVSRANLCTSCHNK